jgi:protein gp37
VGDKSKIEWTDATWNPVRGCSLVSAGCTNCYAMREAHRHSSKPSGAYHGLTRMTEHGPVWTGEVRLVPELLDQPLRWKRPRRIFVNSMSDLFHEQVPDEFIDQIVGAMAWGQQHVFQILTKRPKRMLGYCKDLGSLSPGKRALRIVRAQGWKLPDETTGGMDWPLRNVWLGVSCEDQETADERIPLLLQTPAAVRWISAEPLLGPIDLTRLPVPREFIDQSFGERGGEFVFVHPKIDWVVAGGESGPRARPTHPDWIRSLRDQCQAAGVPFFFKQWGEFGSASVRMTDGSSLFRQFSSYTDWINKASSRVRGGVCLDATGKILDRGADFEQASYPVTIMDRVGKKAAGAMLDGREWREFPMRHSPRKRESITHCRRTNP